MRPAGCERPRGGTAYWRGRSLACLCCHSCRRCQVCCQPLNEVWRRRDSEERMTHTLDPPIKVAHHDLCQPSDSPPLIFRMRSTASSSETGIPRMSNMSISCSALMQPVASTSTLQAQIEQAVGLDISFGVPNQHRFPTTTHSSKASSMSIRVSGSNVRSSAFISGLHFSNSATQAGPFPAHHSA